MSNKKAPLKKAPRTDAPSRLPLISVLVLVAAFGLLMAMHRDKPAEEGQTEKAAAQETSAGSETATEPQAAQSAPDLLPIATVNGQPINGSAFQGQVAMRLQQMQPFADPGLEARNTLKPPLEVKLEVLDQLIGLELAFYEGKKEGYEPSAAELDELVRKVVADYGSEDELNEILANFGETLEDLKAVVSRNQTIRNWRDTAFLTEAMVSDDEAQAYYEDNKEDAKHPDQLRAVQVMFPVPMTAPEGYDEHRQKIKAQAETALTEAKAGASFESLVQKYMNANTRNLTNDGQMGWVSQDGAFPELETALFKLKPGEMTQELVETPFSFHILKALEFRAAGQLTYQDLRPDILDILTNQKIDLALKKKLDALKDTADIVISDPEMAKEWPAFVERIKAQNDDSAQPPAERLED
jgi:parvulin-like peptidyl-prolyl isomerase